MFKGGAVSLAGCFKNILYIVMFVMQLAIVKCMYAILQYTNCLLTMNWTMGYAFFVVCVILHTCIFVKTDEIVGHT